MADQHNTKATLDCISYRPIADEDMQFLRQLYASTRESELAMTDWCADQKAQFISMQFNAQHVHYQQHYADASFDLIIVDGQTIGRLYIQRSDSELRLIDIALTQEYRNRGIGLTIMQQLLDEANTRAVPILLHVEQFNPARRFYQRLGFEDIEQRGIYWFMQYQPQQ